MKLITKSFRRPATTKLTEATIPTEGLCEASDWRSTEIAREHADHSTISVDDCMSMLDDIKNSTEDADENSPANKSCNEKQVEQMNHVEKQASASLIMKTNTLRL